MFLDGEDLDYVAFDPVNSYTMERTGNNSNVLVEYQLNMDPSKRLVLRTAWNFLDFLGLVGGISGSISVIFVMILGPIADHIFII